MKAQRQRSDVGVKVSIHNSGLAPSSVNVEVEVLMHKSGLAPPPSSVMTLGFKC